MAVPSDVSALTLGRARGAAILGQPLSLHVEAQLGPDEDATETCFAAEVFYGDVRLESGRVAVSVSPGNSGQGVSIHVVAAAKVDEPVVAVVLKTICAQKATRKYVLLADIASELTVSAPVFAAQRPPAHVPSVAAKPPTVVETPSTAVEVPKQKAVTRQRATPSKPAPSQVNSGAKRSARLKLTPAPGPERDPTLKSSNELAPSPVDDLQKRVEAVAAWQALNTTTQDVLRDSARMQSMEADLKSLMDLTSKNRKLMADMGARIEQAESDRYSNPLVYGLIVLLFACMAGLVLLWRAQRTATDSTAPWWRPEAPMPRSEPAPVVARTPVQPPNSPDAADLPEVKSSLVADAASPGVDIDLDLGESVFSRMGQAVHVPDSTPSVVPKRDFQQSGMGALRAINTKEMLDVRQQAEFFMALGQHAEAIRILESSIQSSEASNPLIYLDLLKVFHTLSRKTDFDKYRSDFNLQFSGLCPEYAQFNLAGQGLDDYAAVCERITSLWPEQEAIDFIEHCLVRTADASPDKGFDLEAFRDLLMLHGVARRMEDIVDSGLVPFSAPRSTLSELNTLSVPGAGTAISTAPVQIPQPGPDVLTNQSVDLDLSEKTDNLIDFDISGYTNGPETVPPKP